MSHFDVNKIRQDFPILHTSVNGKPLIYFDNAATTQKPTAVIDALVKYYSEINSNVHRGVHSLSEKATNAYEASRKTVQKFINAEKAEEIIFVRGTSEAINLVANSYGQKHIKDNDEIIISTLEHHSNIVPWQMLCERTGAKLKVIPINRDGEIIFGEFEKMISDKTKFISIAYISNSLGTINPVKNIISLARSKNIPVMLDGAQAVQHVKIDVKELDCDFFAFSGHKIYGPTGIGVLYGKESFLNEMPPYQGGGDMIKNVTFERTTYNELPYKFEAGTPNIAGSIGLAAALNYVEDIGIERIAEYEHGLLKYGTEKMMEIEGMRIIGTAKEKASVISFLAGKTHPYDLGTLLDQLGIAVRTGVHCTEPLMKFLKIPGTVRASFAFYNTKEEIDILTNGIKRAISMLI
ncbi:MAG: cysteine desulfurase [Ignavibacteriae bacterium]|nr:cysteine desulfurase [Ignavibacteriota bacterium]